MLVSFGFGCSVRSRVFTVDRAALLCEEKDLKSVAVTRILLWPDFARVIANEASRLTLLRAKITWTEHY